MTPPQVGIMLAPDIVFLDLMDPVLRSSALDYFAVTPETTWIFQPDTGRLVPNGFARAFERVAAGRPFVAHGVGLSLGSPPDEARQDRWFDAIGRDHQRLGFQWYTDHLGANVFGDRNLTLPLPLPWDATHEARTRNNLAALADHVPVVGVENSAFYYSLDDPLAEPNFLDRVTDRPNTHVLLDLHNLHINSINLDFSADAWLERAPLDRVIEIHLAGGVPDPMGSGLLLDSHDAPVPDPVWSLFERVVPRCPNLKGVTLERREGTVTAQDVALVEVELDRIRRTLERAWAPFEIDRTYSCVDSCVDRAPSAHDDATWDDAIATALSADDPDDSSGGDRHPRSLG